MRQLLLLALLASTLLTGCSSTVEARGPSEFCSIHHTYMRTEKISGGGDPNPPSQEYLQARLKYFVHSYPFYLPPHFRRKYVVYLCDDCISAEQAWKAQHRR